MDRFAPPEWRILDHKEPGPHHAEYEITVERMAIPRCPLCASPSVSVHSRTGARNAPHPSFMDIPLDDGYPVRVLVVRKRYRCRTCRRSPFTEPLPGFDGVWRMTRRLVTYIEREVFEPPFARLAQQTGVNEKTVRAIFDKRLAELDAARVPRTPQVLAIDTVEVSGQPRCILGDMESRRAIGLLPACDAATVEHFLRSLPAAGRAVERVYTFPWEPYRSAVRAIFPNATIVVDWSHITALADRAVVSVGRRVRATLDSPDARRFDNDQPLFLLNPRDIEGEEGEILDYWWRRDSRLARVYQACETLYGIGDAPDRAQAVDRYRAWRACIPSDIADDLHPLITVVGEWFDEVFASFDHPSRPYGTLHEMATLRAAVEIMNSTGRGYSLDVMRGLILYHDRQTVVDKVLLETNHDQTMFVTPLIDQDAMGSPRPLSAAVTFFQGASLYETAHRLEFGQWEEP